MNSNEQVALFLQTELHRIHGHVPVVAQVDCVVCEDGDIMAYIYDQAGDCTALVFTRPQGFDPAAVEHNMVRSDTATLH